MSKFKKLVSQPLFLPIQKLRGVALLRLKQNLKELKLMYLSFLGLHLGEQCHLIELKVLLN